MSLRTSAADSFFENGWSAMNHELSKSSSRGARRQERTAPLPPGPGEEPLLNRILASRGELHCLGQLGAESSVQLRSELSSVPPRSGRPVVVDLGRVTFLDCSAIGELVRARLDRRAAGDDLVVRRPSELGRRILELVGLADLIDDGEDAQGLWYDGSHDASQDDSLVTLWAHACTSGASASPLVFVDPEMLVSLIIRCATDEEPISQDADLSGLTVRVVGTKASVAVSQLFVLSGVLHEWARDTDRPGVRGPGSGRLSAGVDATVTALMTTIVAEIEGSSLLDPLTGLLNRRALDRDLAQAIAVSERHAEALSVVMIDVEGLKAVNDRLGHAAGDELLQEVSANVTRALRVGDNAYRTGGDEFVLVLPGLVADDVASVMERVTLTRGASFTWGCSSVSDDLYVVPDPARAPVLLDRADRRMLAFRLRSARTVSGDSDIGGRPVDGDVADRLDVARHGAVAVEQATGSIAERFGLDIADARNTLELVAGARGISAPQAAAMLIDGSMDPSGVARYIPVQPGVSGSAGRVGAGRTSERN